MNSAARPILEGPEIGNANAFSGSSDANFGRNATAVREVGNLAVLTDGHDADRVLPELRQAR